MICAEPASERCNGAKASNFRQLYHHNFLRKMPSLPMVGIAFPAQLP